MNKKIKIFDEETNLISSVTDDINEVIFIEDKIPKVIKLFEPGPPGIRGETGGSPFKLINGIYQTENIIAFTTFISSSLIPTGSFDIGSNANPFNNIYTNNIIIGNSYIINRISEEQQTFLIKSGSVSASFNNDGIFTVSEFNYIPNAISSGIIKFDNDFYIGI